VTGDSPSSDYGGQASDEQRTKEPNSALNSNRFFFPIADLLFVSDGASDISKCFVSRQLHAALDRYLTALPAMSLAPVAPFLSAQPCWCGLHKAPAERLGAR